MTSKAVFASGHCLCGKVKFSINAAPIRMGQCHCEDCRRSSGTGHASNAFFEKQHVIIQGDTSQYDSIADSGATLTRHFCASCGSRLFGMSSAFPTMIGIAVGAIDDSAWFKADAIVYNKSKPVWDRMDESIPTFEEMPPSK